jgi:spermidine/putrescine transport system substrate-binding protein
MPEPKPLAVLAPDAMRPRFQHTAWLAQAVAARSGVAMTRREALGLGGLALLAAACSGTTSPSSSAPSQSLSGQEIEDKLVIYNWAQYEDPKSVDAFKTGHPDTTVKMNFFSDNSELIAKVEQGVEYDVIVPSQNAVLQLGSTGKLMELDYGSIPNYDLYDEAWQRPIYDPDGLWSVVHSYGLTGYIYRNDIVTEEPTTLLDFYDLLPKYGKDGTTSILVGAENVVPLALMALDLDANTKNQAQLDQAQELLMRVRPYVTKITADNLVADAASGKVVLQQTYNGSAILTLAEAKKRGNDFLTWVLPTGSSDRWADNWAIPANAPHPVAAHAWINHFLDPAVVAQTMTYSGYPTPVPAAFDLLAPELQNNPAFNVDQDLIKDYQFILNPDPETVAAREEIYTEFKAGG